MSMSGRLRLLAAVLIAAIAFLSITSTAGTITLAGPARTPAVGNAEARRRLLLTRRGGGHRRLGHDPTCSEGHWKAKSADICCMASCGQCGGTGCSSLSGGAEGCCVKTIRDKGGAGSCDQQATNPGGDGTAQQGNHGGTSGSRGSGRGGTGGGCASGGSSANLGASKAAGGACCGNSWQTGTAQCYGQGGGTDGNTSNESSKGRGGNGGYNGDGKNGNAGIVILRCIL